MNEIKVMYKGGQGELVEKRSRFIATILSVETKEEAVCFINQMKKKYWDATHNCSAFVIGRQNEIQGCSDDGEPSGTAGRPMLDVLLGEQIHNVVVVVTRYFGGTLLGTGGLVRAYQKAVKAGLLESEIIEQKVGMKISIETDYNGVGKIQYILGQRGIPIMNAVYTEAVVVEVIVPKEQTRELIELITEATNGKSKVKLNKAYLYAILENEVHLFDALADTCIH